MLFSLANLSYWIFLAIGVGLFFLVMSSCEGNENFYLDAYGRRLQLYMNLDSDVQRDGNVDSEEENRIFIPFLRYGDAGEASLILLLAINFSSWGLSGWIMNVGIGSLRGEIPVKLFGFGGIVMLVSLVISLYISRLISRPLSNIFATFGEDISSERLIGCEGTVISKTIPYLIDGQLGQADVLESIDNLVTINVSLPQWARVLPHRGAKILIIDRQKYSYIAIAKDSSDEDEWLNRSNQPP